MAATSFHRAPPESETRTTGKTQKQQKPKLPAEPVFPETTCPCSRSPFPGASTTRTCRFRKNWLSREFRLLLFLLKRHVLVVVAHFPGHRLRKHLFERIHRLGRRCPGKWATTTR